METPSNLLYTNDHEWVESLGGNRYRIGITDYAQDQLGDVVFVETGGGERQVDQGEVIIEVESTKSVGEIYAPMGLRVIAINRELADRPELVNSDPYGAGWLVEVEALEPLPESLLDAAAYQNLVG